MKFTILALLFISLILFFAHSNAKIVQKRWVRDEWSPMRDRWRQFGEGIRQRVDTLQERLRRRFGSGPPFTSVSQTRPIFDQSQPSNLSPENFDPSVVVVDKPGRGNGEEEEEEEDKHSFGNFNFEFPMGYNGPKFWSFGGLFKSHRPWWKGPNVCVERRVIEGAERVNETKAEVLEVEDENISGNMNLQSNHGLFSLQSTHCTEADTSYTCVTKTIRGREAKTTIVKYQCCHGFKRNINSGCTQVDLKGLAETMRDLKANRMLQLIEKFGFHEKLIQENFTIFSPTDEGLIEFQDNLNKVENEIEPEVLLAPVRRRREAEDSMSDIVLMHMIPGFVKSGDFDDEQLLNSLSQSQTKIRINIYNNPKRVITANCARVVSTNNYATNGVVHIIDRVMPMPSSTTADMINADPRFNTLRRLIANTDLMEMLNDNSQHMTFFAPTDDAFSRLDQGYLNRLLDGQACVGTFLRNHMVSSVLCSSAIPDYAQIKNTLDLMLPIKREEEKLYIDGIRILETDKLGTNGVIHVIDGVMISEKSQPVSNFLEKHQMKEYLDLIKDSGLLSEWDSMQNVSFFIPSIEAFRSLSTEKIEEIRNNSKEMLAYHVVSPKSESCYWNNDEILESKDGDKIRINVFGDIPGFNIRSVSTAQCARIIEPSSDICDSNIHVVDRFLLPSKGSLIETLDSMQKFTVIRKILNKSGLEQELQTGTFTLLAPSDDTFYHDLSENELNLLINDPEEAKVFSRLHLLPEVVCCSGVNNSPLFISLQQFRTIGGFLISAHKTMNGKVRFGPARVTDCDLMASNGVIHVINKVLKPQPFMTGLQFPMFEMGF